MRRLSPFGQAMAMYAVALIVFGATILFVVWHNEHRIQRDIIETQKRGATSTIWEE